MSSLIKIVKRESDYFNKYEYSYFVSFRYNEQIIYDIKNFNQRYYNFKCKEWELPATENAKQFLDDLQLKYSIQSKNDIKHNIFNYKKQNKNEILQNINIPELHEKSHYMSIKRM